MILDELEKIKQIDKQSMLDAAENFPEHLSIALDLASKAALAKNKKKHKQVIVAGMGGSAIAGDIAAEAFGLDLIINRNYVIPCSEDKEALFIAVSYSGNTDETLNAAKQALKQKARVVAITSGGKLAEMASETINLPSGFQPRAALPYLLVMLLKVLELTGVIENVAPQVEDSIKTLQALKNEYGAARPQRSNPAKQLASKLLNKVPIIFSIAGVNASAGYRFKTQFNENAKATALHSVFPELAHNELVNLHALKRTEHQFSLVVLRDDKNLEKVNKKMEIVKSLIGMQVGGVNEIWAQGRERLSRILSLVYFGDLLSVYLALLKGIDPTPVEVISRLKREMAR